MPFLETPALTIHYETAGRGRAHAIVLHGNFATWRWWKPLLDHVPEGFTVYAPTLRGFGATRTRAPARSIHELAYDVRELARGLGLERFHLLGHSLGGAIALQYALAWPETLHSLGLIAPAPGDGLAAMRSRDDLLGRMMTWTDATWPASRMAWFTAMTWGRILGTYRSTLATSLARMMPAADPVTVEIDALLADAMAIDDRVLVDIYEALRAWDVRAALPQVAVPVRILAGRRDGLVSLSALEALARAMPRARLEVWDDVGHSPQLEKPDAFAHWLALAPASRLARLHIAWHRFTSRVRRIVRSCLRT